MKLGVGVGLAQRYVGVVGITFDGDHGTFLLLGLSVGCVGRGFCGGFRLRGTLCGNGGGRTLFCGSGAAAYQGKQKHCGKKQR
jgi:hypothetical protein